MFKRLLSIGRPSSKAAGFCVDLLNRTRIDAGYPASKPLPVVYATNEEFIGSLLGLVDFMVGRLGDPNPYKRSCPPSCASRIRRQRFNGFPSCPLGPRRNRPDRATANPCLAHVSRL